jgi:uncharacterized membrane protein YkoI
MLLIRLPHLIALSLLVASTPLVAEPRGRTPYADVAQGRILSFADIKTRVDRAVGGRMIGMDYDAENFRYLMRYERGSEIVDIVVDARTGRILNGRERM